jgi:hypothetical protein
LAYFCGFFVDNFCYSTFYSPPALLKLITAGGLQVFSVGWWGADESGWVKLVQSILEAGCAWEAQLPFHQNGVSMNYQNSFFLGFGGASAPQPPKPVRCPERWKRPRRPRGRGDRPFVVLWWSRVVAVA